MEEKNNISQELLETIERYYNNSMNDDERLVFEKKLQNDSEFKNQVEDIKIMLLGIETQALKEQLDIFHQDLPKAKKPKFKTSIFSHSSLAIAATLVIALGVFWFLSGPSNEKLYAKYFKPDPGLPTTMSSSDDFDFYDAMVNYKHGDYEKAIEKWQVLHEKRADNDTINYFLGLAYMGNEHVSNAIPLLEKVVDTKKPFPFLNEAHYYLGLAYLKNNQTDLAKKSLSLSHLESSKKLLSELKD